MAPFFGTQMLGWLVDSGAPSIVIAYILVAAAFVVLHRREPKMDRPLRIGGVFFFYLRIPAGIAPGHDAEERLLESFGSRRF
ncbi:hypothetical protein [Cryobacterium glaciale]|uniref:hypothetical protein n=1 Tax=Cryobacterium glaciale TaxID=1259145 RepID=UPI0030B9CF6B